MHAADSLCVTVILQVVIVTVEMTALLYNASLCSSASGSFSRSSLPQERGAVPHHDPCWKTPFKSSLYRRSMHTSIKFINLINQTVFHILHNAYRQKDLNELPINITGYSVRLIKRWGDQGWLATGDWLDTVTKMLHLKGYPFDIKIVFLKE